MKKRGVLVVLTTALIAITALTGAKAGHEWKSWGNTGSGIQLEVGDNLSQQWKPYLTQAVKDWDASNSVSLTIVSGAGNPDCGFERGRIEICNWNLGATGWGGAAWADLDDDGNVIAMRIIINDYYYTRRAPASARQWVICHELGHGLGLHHLTRGSHGTCMDYTERTAKPGAHDFEQLAEMYGTMAPVAKTPVRATPVPVSAVPTPTPAEEKARPTRRTRSK